MPRRTCRRNFFLDDFHVLQLDRIITAQREIDQDAHDLSVPAQKILRLIEPQFWFGAVSGELAV
jgi:hypothetical protein